MQDQQQQTKARKRVPNFTAEEKALLAHLVKRRPIVQTKYTDAKTVSKKQAAWNLITQEFNSNANVVHKVVYSVTTRFHCRNFIQKHSLTLS